MPVEEGDPPVVMASVPGNESDGREEVAFVYCVPRARSPARADVGRSATYLSRSDWWKPSMLSKRTWSALPRWWWRRSDAVAGPKVEMETAHAHVRTRVVFMPAPFWRTR